MNSAYLKVIPLKGNSQKLDGGAMFGNAPKALWQRWESADEQNRIELSCRSLLVQYQGKNILFEAGIGSFFDPEMKERYGIVESEHVLLESLAAHGLAHTDIDMVILSHLHFDHAGGLLSPWQEGKESELLFPKARFHVSEVQWERACNPHRRDKGSYIPLIQKLLQDSGRLVLVKEGDEPPFPEVFSYYFSHGHTPGLMMSMIKTALGPIIYAADLISASAWVNIAITTGYDRFPELLIDEKAKLLAELAENSGMIAFAHDANIAVGKISAGEKGKFQVDAVTL